MRHRHRHLDQIQIPRHLHHQPAREMAFQFRPAQLAGLGIQLGAEEFIGFDLGVTSVASSEQREPHQPPLSQTTD